MDHHCPWINNCVGKNNKKFFYRFIIWCIFGNVFIAVITAKPYWNVSFEDEKTLQSTTKVARGLILFVFPLCFAISLVVGALLGFQAYLVVKEISTIEFYASRPRKLPCWKRVFRWVKVGKNDDFRV